MIPFLWIVGKPAQLHCLGIHAYAVTLRRKGGDAYRKIQDGGYLRLQWGRGAVRVSAT